MPGKSQAVKNAEKLIKALAKGKKSKKKLATKSFVKKELSRNIVKKYHIRNDATTGLSMSSQNTLRELSQIAQADGNGSREGLRVRCSYLEVKGFISAGDGSNSCRVMLTAYDGVASAITTANFPEQIGTNLSPIEFWTPELRQHQKILYDRRFQVGTNGPGGAAFHIKVPLMGHEILFSAAGATTATEGALMLAVNSDSTAVSHPTFYYTSRLYYVDV